MVSQEEQKEPEEENLVGTRLGRYALRARIARGGTATVYLALDVESEQLRAVKVIDRDKADDPKFVDMLLDEARTTARIEHPNVCAMVDYGGADGRVYLAMEYLEGEPFSTLIRRAWEAGGLPRELSARIIADAAHGLHAAHELADAAGVSDQIVHRDVSPLNILVLDDGGTKMLDFGIARARDRLTKTKVGEVKGTLAYVAPEQLGPGGVDRRADVWSLGVVLFEATTGRRLFRNKSPALTVKNVIQMAIPSPRQIVPDYPEELEAIVMAALERNVGARTRTAGGLASALEAFLATSPRSATQKDVAAIMHTHFEPRIAARRAIRARVGRDSGPELDAQIPKDEPRSTSVVSSEIDAEIASQKKSSIGLVVALLVLALAIGAGLTAWLRPDLLPTPFFSEGSRAATPP
jgi:serine/threonine-protein kinase